MKLVRTIPRLGSLPELFGSYCAHCHQAETIEYHAGINGLSRQSERRSPIIRVQSLRTLKSATFGPWHNCDTHRGLGPREVASIRLRFKSSDSCERPVSLTADSDVFTVIMWYSFAEVQF
jgi:hypothetical protein